MGAWTASWRRLGSALALALFCQACADADEGTCESPGKRCAPDDVRPSPDANAGGSKDPSERDGGPKDDGEPRDAGADAAQAPGDAAVPGDGDAPDSGTTFDASPPTMDAAPAQDAAPPDMDAAPPIVDAGPPIPDAHLPDPDAEPPDPDPYCYSPRQNALRAREKGAYGCPCAMTRANKAGYCVPSGDNWNGVALVCWTDKWLVVDDGPCLPPTTITHAQCVERGGELVVPVDSDASYVITCPNGRQVLGRLTTESGFVVQMPCCKK